ncbi:hypothetical protein D9758_005102 [Tetrapyrgos nigripes]|uniref:Cytochrome P450 n=1 Tax=Tetrapyrgos nigripes TaxID=182062 RepID=A0A8H5LWQ3_9AGAR|nr:hypothetical protein D9758_005102 [Tetrapyrgos nigripes]
MRRACDNVLGLKNAVNYHSIQRNEAVFTAHSLLGEPENWRSHIERTSSSVALSMMYDSPLVQSLQDPSLLWMNRYVEEISAILMPGAFLVEVLPFLRHLPRSLSKWRRDAEESFEKSTAYFEKRFQNIKKQVVSGQEQRPSFCVSLAENQENSKLSDQECAWLAGLLYAAGSETTATTMIWFIFCMVLFPDIQTRAQEELDKVVGRSRVPSFADLKHLPYIHAIVKEILRWRTPHVSAENSFDSDSDPSTTTLRYTGRCRGIPTRRHLDENGQLKDGLLGLSESHFTYGFGQRICVGRHVANNTLFMAAATILWTMRLEGVKDSDGNVVVPDVNSEEENGVLVRPPPFSITTTPRFRDADTFIKEARDEVVEENLVARLDARD